MLTEVFKGVELIINAVKGTRTLEKKRQKVAKQLLKIYLDIERIIERGKDILSFLKGDTTVVRNVAFGKLMAQQRALQNIIDDLNDKNIVSLLKLHLPKFRNLKGLFHPKCEQIGFFISQLVTSKELSDTDRKDFLSRLDQNKIESSRSWEDIALLEMGQPMDLMRIPTTNYFFFRRMEDKDIQEIPVRIFATSDHIREAETVLTQIEELGEELRLFLIDKFKFEDIL
ncbi:MAG: hypothetical protein AB1414_14030 [bacterium]